MVKVYGIAWDMGIPGDELIAYDTYLSETLSKGNYSEIEDWCRTRILHITRQIKDKRLNMLSKPIQTAKEYMDDNFHREIYLEDLSLRVGMSPQYFSRMFKEETGDNFKDYLTNLRIEKAKELLLTTDKSVKEICFQVGYGDPNYFSRLFTKAVGEPPTRYSERNRN